MGDQYKDDKNDNEVEKYFNDAQVFGVGIMKGGQHIPAKDFYKETDYVAWLEDAISTLQKIPEDERSEEVGETLDAVIEDLQGVLSWLNA